MILCAILLAQAAAKNETPAVDPNLKFEFMREVALYQGAKVAVLEAQRNLEAQAKKLDSVKLKVQSACGPNFQIDEPQFNEGNIVCVVKKGVK